MDYDDRITMSTPEGVDLDLTLAGLGSRFVAALIDGVIKWAVIGALFLGAASLGVTPDPGSQLPSRPDAPDALLVLFAVIVVVSFVVSFAYDVLFETLASGRTPGKRWTGIRVLKVDGRAVDFTSSAVRNLLRLVDALPFAYAVGLFSILLTSRNQRLGDLAGGTVVAREVRAEAPRWRVSQARVDDSCLTWDVSGISPEDAAVVRRFLERRDGLPPDARARLAGSFASRLRPRVVGAPERLGAEDFLEGVVVAKTARS